ncbi:MAG TPA: methyltransferase domain-containing protein [Patescibacteria group bacterium]|nr:methyltransferase domain-containing protein [Patescibacteria group bacterium]
MADRIQETREKIGVRSVAGLVGQYAAELDRVSEEEFFAKGSGVFDQISTEAIKANFAALTESEKAAEFREILARIPEDSNRLDLFTCRRYVNVVTALVDLETELGKETAGDLLDFVQRQYGDKIKPRWINFGFRRGLVDREAVMIMNLLEPKNSDLYLRALAGDPSDLRWNEKVGMLIKALGMPALADRLRFLLGYGKVGSSEGKNLEFLLRDILGYPELEKYYLDKGVIKEGERLPLPLSLSEVYENYDFSRYPVSLETERFRMKNLMKIFAKIGIGKEAKICDAGCGTGWLTGELLEADFTKVTGFDIDQVNLKKAKELYPGANFVQGDIDELGELFRDQKPEVVLMLGRTGTHAEDWSELNDQMMAINESLEMGGILIMDWPNPQAKGGIYEEYATTIRRAYRRHGFSEEELDDLAVVVDGPATMTEKSKQVYNRLVPKIGRLKERLRSWGFLLELEEVEELPNGTGKDENVVLVLRKVEDYGPAAERAHLQDAFIGQTR